VGRGVREYTGSPPNPSARAFFGAYHLDVGSDIRFR
jgi:hypothetical protein